MGGLNQLHAQIYEQRKAPVPASWFHLRLDIRRTNVLYLRIDRFRSNTVSSPALVSTGK